MSDVLFMAVVWAVLSWLAVSWMGRWISQNVSRERMGFAAMGAGFAPTLALIVATVPWHLHARAQFEASGATEGFMSPAIIVLMISPLLAINLVLNLVVAIQAARK